MKEKLIQWLKHNPDKSNIVLLLYYLISGLIIATIIFGFFSISGRTMIVFFGLSVLVVVYGANFVIDAHRSDD